MAAPAEIKERLINAILSRFGKMAEQHRTRVTDAINQLANQMALTEENLRKTTADQLKSLYKVNVMYVHAIKEVYPDFNREDELRAKLSKLTRRWQETGDVSARHPYNTDYTIDYEDAIAELAEVYVELQFGVTPTVRMVEPKNKWNPTRFEAEKARLRTLMQQGDKQATANLWFQLLTQTALTDNSIRNLVK